MFTFIGGYGGDGVRHGRKVCFLGKIMDVHLIIFSKKLGPPNQQVFRLRPSGALWQKCENSKFSEKTILVAVAGGGDFGWNID